MILGLCTKWGTVGQTVKRVRGWILGDGRFFWIPADFLGGSVLRSFHCNLITESFQLLLQSRLRGCRSSHQKKIGEAFGTLEPVLFVSWVGDLAQDPNPNIVNISWILIFTTPRRTSTVSTKTPSNVQSLSVVLRCSKLFKIALRCSKFRLPSLPDDVYNHQ